ncbi:hypothetical protein EJD97_008423 [Solanum chilense]|uniref:Uncharacterized protein n=1 Tax=Solanum chilense TaxID=4083 RepID=A0A6N2BSN8_SOLCI|nr:hypothetical protein EJD97_008423 [Solanum chilense]
MEQSSLDSSKLTSTKPCDLSSFTYPTGTSLTPCLLVFNWLICTQLHDGSPLGQSSLDSSKLTGTTRVLAYSSFTGLFVPSYNLFPYKRKKGPRPILNRQQLRPSEVKSLPLSLD